MKNLERAYRLINTLNRSEKRYFNKYTDLHRPQSDQDYLTLFKLIASQEDFDIDKLQSKIEQKGLNYVSIKTQYLYQTLLDALTQYHKKSQTEILLNDILQQLFILEGKGLLEEALTLCKELKEKADKAENYVILLQVIQKEIEVLSLLNHGQATDPIKQCYAQKNEVFEKISQIQTFENLRNDLIRKLQSHQLNLEDIETLKQHPLLQSSTHSSLKIQLLFEYIWTIIHFYEQDFEQMLHCASQTLNIVLLRDFAPSLVLRILRNYFVACQINGTQEYFAKGSEILAQIDFKYKPYKVRKLLFQYGCEIQCFLLDTSSITSKKMDNFQTKIDDFQKHFVKYLSWENKKTWWFDLLDFYIVTQYFDRAEKVLMYFEESIEFKKLKKIEKLILRLVQAIIYFENQEESLLLREIRAIKHLISTSKSLDHVLIVPTVHLFQDLNKTNTSEHFELFRLYYDHNKTVSPALKESIWSLNFLISWVQNHLK